MQTANLPESTPTQPTAPVPFIWETPRLLRLDEGTRNVEGKSNVNTFEFNTSGRSYGPS